MNLAVCSVLQPVRSVRRYDRVTILVCSARGYAAAFVHERQIHSCYSAIDTASLSSPSGCTMSPLGLLTTRDLVALCVS